MMRWITAVLIIITLSQVKCILPRSYPETFVQSPPKCDTIELAPALKGRQEQPWNAVLKVLRDGWEREAGWKIDIADKDRGYIRTAWRYGYSCWGFGDYRRRITLQFAPKNGPVDVRLITEAERMERTARVLYWGGEPVGWIAGFDPAFQRRTREAISSCLAVRLPSE